MRGVAEGNQRCDESAHGAHAGRSESDSARLRRRGGAAVGDPHDAAELDVDHAASDRAVCAALAAVSGHLSAAGIVRGASQEGAAADSLRGRIGDHRDRDRAGPAAVAQSADPRVVGDSVCGRNARTGACLHCARHEVQGLFDHARRVLRAAGAAVACGKRADRGGAHKHAACGVYGLAVPAGAGAAASAFRGGVVLADLQIVRADDVRADPVLRALALCKARTVILLRTAK